MSALGRNFREEGDLIEMRRRALSSTILGKAIDVPGSLCSAGAVVVAILAIVCMRTQALQVTGSIPQKAQDVADLTDIFVKGGRAETVEYQGRKALRLTTQSSSDEVFAFINGAQIRDGTIEADIAMKTTTPSGVRTTGFVGIAFRTRRDASHYEMFYLRTRDSPTEDKAMRNLYVQYVAAPGYDWHTLHREWPGLYESYVDLQPEHWNNVKIEVHGRTAKLFVNGSETPSLIVNGLKGQDLRGNIALWSHSGEGAYFSDVRVTPATAEFLTNDGEISGRWAVEFTSDYGNYNGSMDLHREGNLVTGKWTGDFGNDKPVSGMWRNGYVELTFNGMWPVNQVTARATLAGWIDIDSGEGQMKLEGWAQGQWTARRKK